MGMPSPRVSFSCASPTPRVTRRRSGQCARPAVATVWCDDGRSVRVGRVAAGRPASQSARLDALAVASAARVTRRARGRSLLPRAADARRRRRCRHSRPRPRRPDRPQPRGRSRHRRCRRTRGRAPTTPSPARLLVGGPLRARRYLPGRDGSASACWRPPARRPSSVVGAAAGDAARRTAGATRCRVVLGARSACVAVGSYRTVGWDMRPLVETLFGGRWRAGAPGPAALDRARPRPSCSTRWPARRSVVSRSVVTRSSPPTLRPLILVRPSGRPAAVWRPAAVSGPGIPRDADRRRVRPDRPLRRVRVGRRVAPRCSPRPVRRGARGTPRCRTGSTAPASNSPRCRARPSLCAALGSGRTGRGSGVAVVRLRGEALVDRAAAAAGRRRRSRRALGRAVVRVERDVRRGGEYLGRSRRGGRCCTRGPARGRRGRSRCPRTQSPVRRRSCRTSRACRRATASPSVGSTA